MRIISGIFSVGIEKKEYDILNFIIQDGKDHSMREEGI